MQTLSPRTTLVLPTSPDIFTPLSEQEQQVWTTGPSDSSGTALGYCLSIIAFSLSRLVKVGQGKTTIFTKNNAFDLVTEVDQGIELLLRDWIGRFFPHHKIIGEEGAKDFITPKDTVWYIDPIDGTTNFVEHNNQVAMHIGCVRHGKPWVCLLGLPIQDQFYVYDGQQTWQFSDPTDRVVLEAPPISYSKIGTEYMESQKKQDQIFTEVTESLGLSTLRVRSIGVNIAALLQGKSTAFYKPKARMWDVIAPLGVVYGLYKGHFSIQLRVEGRSVPLSLFSNRTDVCDAINDCYFSDGEDRLKLVLAYPKVYPQIGRMIRRRFRD